MTKKNSMGTVYQRQVDKSKRQILFRNIEPQLISDLDQICNERGITRKVAFMEMCAKYIFSHRYTPQDYRK
ncbi:hypothetical protein CMI48_04105 [Candidatus Pacearchaeota archaeon]|jgi:hypothetical protein|nr:hypothetical protein [Candidatus Pacearchaeota archaeon]|tara:strand:- start:2049 stop:2261 length:213 start_codon:yes stop_codon:yes gene_type:complete